MGTEKESVVLAKILRECSGGAVRLFRNQVGRYKIGERWINYGLVAGSSDIIGFKSVVVTPDMIGKKIAVLVAIECKREGENCKPHQQQFIDFIQASGGLAGVARSAEDAVFILRGD